MLGKQKTNTKKKMEKLFAGELFSGQREREMREKKEQRDERRNCRVRWIVGYNIQSDTTRGDIKTVHLVIRIR